ncbi:MAG: RsmE family RNA methyltransferase, partial [Lysobacteraceae bacterium]
RVPTIDAAVAWERLFDALEPPAIVAWEEERDLPLRKAIAASASALSVVIGPEGGLSSEEVALARGHGALTVSLGPRNLRSETAAIAAIAQLISLAEEGGSR